MFIPPPPSFFYLDPEAYLTRCRTIRDEIYLWTTGIEGVVRVAPYQATQWNALLAQGSTVTLTIPNANRTVTYLEELENNENGGYMAGFLTSWGPSWELNLSPHVAAPGENIVSTYPVSMGSYRVMTGTSMGRFNAVVRRLRLLTHCNSCSLNCGCICTARRGIRQDRSWSPAADLNDDIKATSLVQWNE